MEYEPGCESFTLKVKVEQIHIDVGKRLDECFCPIALAVKNAIPGCMEVFAGYGSLVVFIKEGGRRAKRYEGVIPAQGNQFMLSFDNDGSLPSFIHVPFEFEVTLSQKGNEF